MRIRTEYSCNFAFGKLVDVFNYCNEIGGTHLAISDRYSTFGFIQWNDLCVKAEKKPIFGVEIGVSHNGAEKRPHISYWSFFAIDDVKAVNDLFALATSQPNACLTYEQANNALGVLRIADNRAKLDLCDPEKVAIALSPSIPFGYYKSAKKIGFNFIMSSDNQFLKAKDKETYRIMLGRNAFSSTYDQYIQTLSEWDLSLEWVDRQDRIDAVYNRTQFEIVCTAKLPKPALPKIEAPASLRELCEAGAKRLGMDLEGNYGARLDHELKTIYEKKFEDYFYIVSELMLWARQRMIVAPGRGSSAGSLVCYLLGVTSVDPIKYNLLFERFLDITRSDLPDIDMDFDANLRHLVFEHLEELYGKDKVAKLCAVTRYRPKTIISTAAVQLRIPLWLSKKAAEELHGEGDVDSRALTSFADSFAIGEYSQKLTAEYPEISYVHDVEMHAKNFSIHAAGAVITDGEISRYVAVDSRNDTIQADKYTSEKAGLLKLDLLSLNQLSVFARTLELIGVDATNAFLDGIPLDDQEAFDIINKKRYAGVFQMGRALISLFKHFGVNKLEDIVAVTSLARPGPLSSGAATRWVDCRVGLQRPQYAHDCLEPYLKDTFGEVVYQEQLMQIAQHIGGMSIEDVSSLRRAVAKSKGAEALRPYGDKFKTGASQHGFIGESVDKFWDDLCGFGAYSFNRSHAVVYSITTYYCCWFKAFYPVEYAAASLDAESDPDNQIKLLRELNLEGVGYVPIDAETSTDRWTIKQIDGKKTLVGPLTSIKGIGPASLAQIIEARATGKPLPAGLAKKLAEAITPIDSLTPIKAAVARCIPDLAAKKITSPVTPIARLQAGDRGEYMIIGLLKGLKRKDRNDAESVARRKGKRLSGKTVALNMTMKDDSDSEIVAIIDPADFDKASPSIMERGGIDKSIYAIKGTIPNNFRMLSVTAIRFLCNIDDGLNVIKDNWFTEPQDKEDYFATREPIQQKLEQEPESERGRQGSSESPYDIPRPGEYEGQTLLYQKRS